MSLSTPNSTYYNYDALGRVLQTIQGQQMRTYQYDSLGRAMQSSIPETGYVPVSATYADFGAPLQIVDPRVIPGTTTHIATTFTYDSLNRIKTVTYNDGTPNVTYTYGAPQAAGNTGGRVASVTNGVETEAFQYDVMGRPTLSTKTI